MELTTGNMTALQKWQEAGDRSVKIEINKKNQLVWEDEPVRIWIFDYSHMIGFHIHSLYELPTDTDLVGIKRKRLKEQLAECSGEE